MAGALTGGCACGAIRYQCSAEPLAAGHCHCRSCQQASGTGHGSHLMVPRAAVEITGAATFYDRRADSGHTVSRGFCATCGAPVYSTNSGFPDALFLRAGSLDDPNRFRPGVVVYAACAPVWDHTDPTLPRFETMPDAQPGAPSMARP